MTQCVTDRPPARIFMDSDLRNSTRSYKRGGSRYFWRKEWGSWGREGSNFSRDITFGRYRN